MYTDVQIINLGLSKLGSSRIARIDPPATSLERFCSEDYPHWRRSEVSKRRWVCATEHEAPLALLRNTPGVALPYAYSLPKDCLRPIREDGKGWVQRKRELLYDGPDLKLTYIADVPENQYDEMLVEVLAARIAVECVEFVTQSNTKKADAMNMYTSAVKTAGMQNAYVIGPEDVQSEEDPFLAGRYQHG